jgi:hypothetical protein
MLHRLANPKFKKDLKQTRVKNWESSGPALLQRAGLPAYFTPRSGAGGGKAFSQFLWQEGGKTEKFWGRAIKKMKRKFFCFGCRRACGAGGNANRKPEFGITARAERANKTNQCKFLFLLLWIKFGSVIVKV